MQSYRNLVLLGPPGSGKGTQAERLRDELDLSHISTGELMRAHPAQTERYTRAGQLVPDNQVLIGGSPAGSVESIELSDDNLAEVHVEVDQELHEGTTATIRATSLSGVANHYVSISPGPNSSPALDEGA